MKLSFLNDKVQLAGLATELKFDDQKVLKKWEEIKFNHKLNDNKIDDLI